MSSKPRQLVVRFFNALSRYAIRHPKPALVIATVVTLTAAPGIFRLKLRTDGQALVPQGAPEVIFDRTIRNQFGLEDQVIVLVQSGHAEGIFNPGTLQLIRDLTERLKKIPGINPSNVTSLATEPGFRLQPVTRVREKLLERTLETRADLDQLRDDLRKIELYTGTLVSADGKSAVILVGAPDGGDNTQLCRRIQEAVASIRPPPAERIRVTGAPVAEALLGIHILVDLGVPKSLLGASTQPGDESPSWRLPASLHELRLLLVRRIGLLPLAVAVMLAVFLISFRNVPATLLLLPGAAATMLFVFGLMGWVGVPIYLTMAIMPVLLITLGVTNDIYLFNRYFTRLRENPEAGRVALVRETFDQLVSPVASTSLTAAIGLASFGFSPLGPVKVFGLVSSVGVLFGLFYSLTVIPAMLTLVPPAWLLSGRRRAAGGGSGGTGHWFASLGLAAARHRWRVAGLLVVVAGVAPFGLHRLVVQDSWLDGFDPDSEFRRATQLVNDQFHGTHLLYVSFDAPRTLRGELPASAVTVGIITLPGNLVEEPSLLPGLSLTLFPAGGPDNAAPTNPVWRTQIQMASRMRNGISALTRGDAADLAGWQSLSGRDKLRFELTAQPHLRPDIIRTLRDFSAFLREQRQYGVGGVLGPAEYLATTHFMANPDRPGSHGLPLGEFDTKLTWDYYRVARGPERLRQIVDTNYQRSLTTVFLKEANFVDTAKLMAAIRAYESENLAPKGITLGFAGDVALSQTLIKDIVTTQLQSLFWSLAGIFLVTSLLGGSLRWGVYCVLPSALAVLVKFAVMGWCGIPLGVATSMFAAMTLGIGVNCAIHLLEGCRQARAAGASPDGALSRSLELTGPPALINTVAVSLGFGVLMLSQVPANSRLGLLLVLGLVNCLVASLLLLPVLLHCWPLREDEARAGKH